MPKAFQQLYCSKTSVSGTADQKDVAISREFFRFARQGGERDVDRVGDMPRLPLVVSSHIDEQRTLV